MVKKCDYFEDLILSLNLYFERETVPVIQSHLVPISNIESRLWIVEYNDIEFPSLTLIYSWWIQDKIRLEVTTAENAKII